MPIKLHHKHRMLWATIIVVVICAVTALFAPTMVNLNGMRQKIESTIVAETGMPVKINGDINFGVLGKTTIVAHDIKTPYGDARSISIKIPFYGLFDTRKIKLDGPISISGAEINLKSLANGQPLPNISVQDSVINFMGKDYSIINGMFSGGAFNGLVRTGQHKYDIKFQNREFTITNKNVDLNIRGELYASGTASGTLDIFTDKINSWFEFSVPEIKEKVKLSTDFWWDGKYGFKFRDIVANNVRGRIDLDPNGQRTISMYSNNVDFDFSFLAKPQKILRNTKLDIDFNGRLTFENQTFKHIKIDAIGIENNIQINTIIADNTSFTGGNIDSDGAHNIMIKTTIDNKKTACLFSGNPNKWSCAQFVFGDFHGFISKDKKSITGEIISERNVSSNELEEYISKFGASSVNIKFKFKNMGGRYIANKNESKLEYTYVYGKALEWLNPHIHLLPKFMIAEPGNMIWNGDSMTFSPNSGGWSLTLQNNFFILVGTNIKDTMPLVDLRAIKNIGYSVSGFYNDHGDISDLTLKIAGHTFTGTANTDSITLNTNVLEIGAFLNSEFFDRYEEMEYIANDPVLIPFELDKNIYLSANTLIHGENIYKNFVYSLKSGTQTFSISDNARGNLLATIIKERASYDIFMQLNKFVINGTLLSSNFPLNIMDTAITAELNIKTSGHIAHDIWYNMAGDLDLTFDGGYIVGIGIDDFYNNAENITRLNLENILLTTLESGYTKIKNMRVIGQYENGNFATTKPITISMRHADAVGAMDISNGMMTTKLDILMRAVAPEKVNMSITIAPNGRRKYSLTEILRYFDPAFMRSFIKTHDKF